jgi:hypothetical protein
VPTQVLKCEFMHMNGQSAKQEQRKKKKRGEMAMYSQRLFRAGAPDCPVCTGHCPVRQASAKQTGRSREFADGVWLKITGLSGVHRTVR